ncbi:MAG: radical SAM protein [Bacteroidales bacterium]|nr:radical SAM protein [Bacteroidales bacterium]
MESGKKYAVNEIFLSLQGEGFWTGTPMVFLRFSGCNLRCPFCDTDFTSFTLLTGEEILLKIQETAPKGCKRICITGGEPSLQLDSPLVDLLHGEGFILHIETNGTHPLPEGIDWVTLSPKSDFVPSAEVVIGSCDELKVVYTGQDFRKWESFPAINYFLQPCSCSNTGEVVKMILENPKWRLSLQTHKYIGIA